MQIDGFALISNTQRDYNKRSRRIWEGESSNFVVQIIDERRMNSFSLDTVQCSELHLPSDVQHTGVVVSLSQAFKG